MPSSLHHLNKERGLIVFSSLGKCDCSVCPVVNVTPIRKPLICFRQPMPTFPSTSTFPSFIPHSSIVLPPSTKKIGFPITFSARRNPIKVHQITHLAQGAVSSKTYGGGQDNPILLSELDPESSVNWRPSAQLPYGRSNHSLDTACTQQSLTTLVQYCNRLATVIFVQHHIKKEMHITTTDLRDLLSHSKPIADETIKLYLELLTTQYDITYLATNTIPKLQGEGWTTVQRSFASFRNRRRTNARPRMTGESAIIIPCYVDNCHWVTVVRREVNGQVIFLFADDMNNSRTEQDIKQLLSTQSTSPIFHPPSAKWIVCRNYTHIPHSNECGPRSLVAATIMALHPNPSNYILLPSMHNNLAQISRTWVAISLLKNNRHQPAIQLLCAPSRMTFPRVTRVPSAPLHLIPWTNNSNTPPNRPTFL